MISMIAVTKVAGDVGVWTCNKPDVTRRRDGRRDGHKEVLRYKWGGWDGGSGLVTRVTRY